MDTRGGSRETEVKDFAEWPTTLPSTSTAARKSATPKASWPWVKTLLHSVYDQPDAAGVHAQFDRVLDALAEKLPKVADHLEAAREDILAFTPFPKGLWRQVWSNNPQERLNGNPPPHRRRWDLPRPHRVDPPGRRRPGRTARRMDRIPPLPQPRPHPTITGPRHHPGDEGGHRPGAQRLTNPRITRQPRYTTQMDLTHALRQQP